MTEAGRKAALHAAAGLIIWGGLFIITDSFCWFQALFGIPCPGCGSTRAALALFHGHFAEAFAWHPLIILSLVILPYAVFRDALSRRMPITGAEKTASICVVALYIVVYAIRMALLFPHTQPMVMLQDAIWPKILRLIIH
jgi:hypothetical protein